jgi:hypothetical protein
VIDVELAQLADARRRLAGLGADITESAQCALEPLLADRAAV